MSGKVDLRGEKLVYFTGLLCISESGNVTGLSVCVAGTGGRLAIDRAVANEGLKKGVWGLNPGF